MIAIVLEVDEPRAVAEAAGLTYVSDEVDPGYRRRRRGRGFSYLAPDGGTVSGATRAALEALAVPPGGPRSGSRSIPTPTSGPPAGRWRGRSSPPRTSGPGAGPRT